MICFNKSFESKVIKEPTQTFEMISYGVIGKQEEEYRCFITLNILSYDKLSAKLFRFKINIDVLILLPDH